MLKVLIVEDSLEKQDKIISTLKDSGIFHENITVATNVADALINLKLNYFDIVILDLNLPFRKNNSAKNDAGITILNKMEQGQLIVPGSVIGCTAYSNLLDEYHERFRTLDFHIYSTVNTDLWLDSIANKIDWITKSKNSKDRSPESKVVVTIHGINTAGEWQESLAKVFGDDCDFIIKDYKYIKKSVFKLFWPKWKSSRVNLFIKDFRNLMIEYPNSEFYFFCHSFGSYILAHALRRIPSHNCPKIKVIALAGSALKQSFKWDDIAHKCEAPVIYNYCGKNDWALSIAYLFVPGLGKAGKVGFDGFNNTVVHNRFFDGGHSFFEKSDDFYERHWIPLLKDG